MRIRKQLITATLILAFAGITLQFLFSTREIPPLARISQDYEFRTKWNMQTVVLERKTQKPIFWFNLDNGPFPKSIQKSSNGDWIVVLSYE